MSVYLSEYLDYLPKDEVGRLQKQLRIILRNWPDREQLKKTLRSQIRREAGTWDRIQAIATGEQSVIFRLFDSFGVLDAGGLNDQERAQLEKLPFVIRQEEAIYLLAAEALEVFAENDDFCRAGFLFSYIRNLPGKEIRAWSRWLRLDDDLPVRGSRVMQLYRRIARLRSSTLIDEEGDRHFPEGVYLDEIFPDDLKDNHVAWFYRGVLGLYDSLAEAERDERCLSDRSRDTIALLKNGRLRIEGEKPVFGRKTRYRLHGTRENGAGCNLQQFNPRQDHAENREQYLF